MASAAEGTGWFSKQWPDLKSRVAGFALRRYYLDMRWKDIAYALVMAGVIAMAFITVTDLGWHAAALWRHRP
jgi:hypothetical protein